MEKSKKYIAIFLLALFAVVQLGGAHELSHEDETAPCDICMALQDVQFLDYLNVPPLMVPAPCEEIIEFDRVVEVYAFAKAESPTSYFTTRPPPALI